MLHAVALFESTLVPNDQSTGSAPVLPPNPPLYLYIYVQLWLKPNNGIIRLLFAISAARIL